MQLCIQQHLEVQLDGADELFDSEILNIRGYVSIYIYRRKENYDYYCILHPWMLGTVNVE